MSGRKFVYNFEETKKLTRNKLKYTLGAKGASIAILHQLDIPVPDGFTIICQACINYFEQGLKFVDILRPQVVEAVNELERKTGKLLGRKENPLIISVRSGAPVSMPGMLDTIPNLGLNDEIVDHLCTNEDECFVLDCYKSFIEIFSEVTIGIDRSEFKRIDNLVKSSIGPKAKDSDFTPTHLRKIIKEYKNLYKEFINEDFPQEPKEQLYEAIRGVFESWERPRAKYYRKMNNIPNFGTAVSIQQMKFGNKGGKSMTGVAFTRDPSTGVKRVIGDYLINEQGHALLSGNGKAHKLNHMEQNFPKLYKELLKYMDILEKHYKDMQYIEFTIEEAKLYILQTRPGDRTQLAAVKIAIDLLNEGIISENGAVLRIDPYKIDQLLLKRIEPNQEIELLIEAVKGSPGAASGEVVFSADKAEFLHNKGKKIILIKSEIKSDDIHGIFASEGVVTAIGGKTSEAAVVARGLGIPAVVGASKIKINNGKMRIGRKIIKEGDLITIDGSSGIVVRGTPDLIEPEMSDEFRKILEISDNIRKISIRVNADTETDAQTANYYGCQGIGLARTEHMFLAPERLPLARDFLFARTSGERTTALEKIKPMQKEDFRKLFVLMNGKPVTIRLLDMPLYEILPDILDLVKQVAVLEYRKEIGDDVDEELKEKRTLKYKVYELSERNPMFGLRGSRLGILWPEVFRMQIEAIFESACELVQEGYDIQPEISIPLIGFVREFKAVKEEIEPIAKRIIKNHNVKLSYKIGTMIEVPRSALKADAIAKEADFFSFGTNDLTKMTMGFSRNAEKKIVPVYVEKGLLRENPFETIDVKGMGKLIKLAIEGGKKEKPTLEFGVCGVHAEDPPSIEFFHKIGIDYISCTPFKIPIARIAAAQAQIRNPR